MSNHGNPQKRCLVTGGAGFLGSALCQRLVEMGHDVICFDNFFTGTKSNIEHLIGKPNFEIIRGDVVNPIHLEVDWIFNLACPASPVHYQFDPIKTMKTSWFGAYHTLGLAKRCRARIMQASTSEVYGDPVPEFHPQPEHYRGNVSCTGVRACYDEGKRSAETLFFDYHRQNKVDIKVARFFNIYGPRMHPQDGRVVSNFIMQALNNQDITIYGRGIQTRSFCYVDDCIRAIIAFMLDETTTGPINIGNPSEISMVGLAQLIIDLTCSKSKIIHLNIPNDDPSQRKPDISLAKSVLNWEPEIQLREGILRTIDYFRSIDVTKFHKPSLNTAHKTSEEDDNDPQLSPGVKRSPTALATR